MKAVILAAGLGRRLRPITEGLPKCLLPIDGEPLLSYTLMALAMNGIKNIVIVVGYCGNLIKKKYGNSFNSLNISYVINPEFAETGSMFSLSKAYEEIKNDDILLLESDLLFSPHAVRHALNSKSKNLILTTTTRGTGDEVYVYLNKKKGLIYLGKNLINHRSTEHKLAGELVGISRFGKDFVDRLIEDAKNDYAKGELKHHYEEVVLKVALKGLPVAVEHIVDLPWTEIDDLSDLERARNKIYPQIKEEYNGYIRLA